MSRKNYELEFRKRVKLLVFALIAIFVILLAFNKEDYFSKVVGWSIALITGLGFTAISSSFVQRISNGVLEKIMLTINIKGRKYSISFFVIVSMLVKQLLF